LWPDRGTGPQFAWRDRGSFKSFRISLVPAGISVQHTWRDRGSLKSFRISLVPAGISVQHTWRDRGSLKNFRISLVPAGISVQHTQEFELKALRLYKPVRYMKHILCHSNTVLLEVLYGCETWSLTLKEEHRVRRFENIIQRRLAGQKRFRLVAGCRKLRNEELHNFHSSPSVLKAIKSRRMSTNGGKRM
jgi:hypothetical protein